MRRYLLAAVAALTLLGAAPVPAPASWTVFRDAAIEEAFRLNPGSAVYQGRHDFDGRIADWSAAGLARQAAFLRRTIAGAKGFSGLTGAERFERDYLEGVRRAAVLAD